MYDEDGNYIGEDQDLNNNGEDEGGDEEGDSGVKMIEMTQEEYDALMNKARRADVLKQKAGKYAQQKRTSPNKDEELEALRSDVQLLKNEKINAQITSIYADADIEQVQSLIQKGLTVDQAVKALYADEISSAKTTTFGIVGRAGGSSNTDSVTQQAIEMSRKGLGL